MNYETIVFGGGLYAVGINGIKLITDNFGKLKDKKLIIFGVGASPVRPVVVEEVKSRNLNKEQQESVDFFLLRGGFDNRRLRPLDRVLMQIMKMKLKSKKHPTPDERGMLNAYSHPVDFTDEKHIQQIINRILE
jgi:hypothetical protein